MKIFLIYIYLIFVVAAPVSVLSQDEHDDHDEHDVDSHEEHSEHNESTEDGGKHQDLVKLTQAEMDEFGVIVSTATQGKIYLTVTVPGEVTVNFDRQAHVAPRFPGIVTQVKKHLGDDVKKGDVLAIIESNEGLVAYEIKSLLDGTIIEKHITIGEVLNNQSPAFIIADLSTVWINLSIYQKHLPFVKVGQDVIVTSSGQEFSNSRGKISYLSPIVDELTRTANARVVLTNENGNLRPGLFIEGEIQTHQETVAVLVPKSSLQKFEGEVVIFIVTPDGFKPVPVIIGLTNNDSAEILSGLLPGQKYVSKGGFTLRTELEKSSLSSGHSH